MKTPMPFEGAHDVIDRFLEDCRTYFEAFCNYYLGVPSFMVIFATSLLEGEAQRWWVHLREEYWYILPYNYDLDDIAAQRDYDARPRYQYPSWEDFTDIFHEQFHSPAAKEMHEARMGEIRMGNGPATVFFRALKWEVKLAGRQNDESDQGTLVHAVQRGIPLGYTSIISNIGVTVLQMYTE